MARAHAGGRLAAGLFWGGIALGIFALLWLWFTSPLYSGSGVRR